MEKFSWYAMRLDVAWRTRNMSFAREDGSLGKDGCKVHKSSFP